MIKYTLLLLSLGAYADTVSYVHDNTQDNTYFASDKSLVNNELYTQNYHEFLVTGKGQVNVGSRQSYSIWTGITAGVKMKGIGSAHGFTALGELYPTTYNELGGFQAELTNMGSLNGTISGTEMLLKDSPDFGKTSTPTKLQPVVGRIAQYNPSTVADNFYASSEGTIAPHSILTGNPNATWQTGIDFSKLKFSSGNAAVFPNNFALSWVNNSGTIVPVFSYNQTGTVFFTDNRMRFVFSQGGGVFTSILEADKNGIYINVKGVMKQIVLAPLASCGSGYSCLAVKD